jgi:teichoic acid transport system ATP-binding protein
MSSDIAISVENLTKIYQIYDKPQDRLKQSLWRGRKRFYKEFWALRDVSINIEKGQTVGIIGKNGSGKSTLLQLIVGTLQPTSGSINVSGKIAALLELGSGFNPEFTGRENAILNGAIMGLAPQEVQERMPLIEQFAEIGEFMDQPVKLYSSGMFVRLAFACAIHVNPDILIVDEALAVGDMQFQLKCIEKMKAFKREGKTILFVSHDVYSVRNFCDQAIWMMDGKIYMSGDTKSVTDSYQDFMKFGLEGQEAPTIPSETRNNILSIDKVYFLDKNQNPKRNFAYGEPLSIGVEYTLFSPMEDFVGGVALFDKQNNYICGLNTKLDQYPLPSKPGKYTLNIFYEDIALLPGTFFVDVGFFESSGLVRLDYKSRADYFTVCSSDYFAEGLMFLKHRWIARSRN